jgi:hypothetical protein
MTATTTDQLSAQDEQQVRDTLLAFYRASTSGNLAFFDNHFHHVETGMPWPPPFAPDNVPMFTPPGIITADESLFIGTDNEFKVTHKDIKQFWSDVFKSLKAKGTKYPNGGLRLTQGKNIMISGSGRGRVAWISDQPTMTMVREKPYDVPCRFTGVLVQEDVTRKWTFTHAHLSVATPDEELLGYFSSVEKSDLAQGNQQALIASFFALLKAQQLPAERWTSYFGDQLVATWDKHKGKGHAVAAREIGLNFASFGAKVDHLGPQGTGTLLKMTWHLQAMLDKFPGATWEDVDKLILLGQRFVGRIGLKFAYSRNGEALTITVTP